MAGAETAQEFDLNVVERIDIGEPVADGPGEKGVGLEQLLLSHDFQYGRNGRVPLRLKARDDLRGERLIRNELRVAGRDAHVAFGQHHVHIR